MSQDAEPGALAQQAAEVQAQLDAQSLREWEQEQQERRKADEKLVGDSTVRRSTVRWTTPTRRSSRPSPTCP